MNGSIRMLAGFMIAFGAVGTLEIDNSASLLSMLAVGLVGAGIMLSGVNAYKNSKN